MLCYGNTIKWSSSKESVATVSQEGIVKGKKAGVAYIKAVPNISKKVSKIKVTVRARKTIYKNDSNSKSSTIAAKKNTYILPFSDSRYLTVADLKGLTMQELRLARNEIYARHGRKFLDPSLQKYFNEQKWYSGYIEPEEFIDSEELTKLERKNAKFILKHENKRG